MIGNIVKSLAVSSMLLASAAAFAQGSGNTGNSGNSGNSGNFGSGNSGSFGIDFFAGSVVGGSNLEKAGGFTSSIEAAFEGRTHRPGTSCVTGDLKCDK